MTMPTTPVTWEVIGSDVHQDTQLSRTGPGIETVWVVPYRITSGPARGSQGEVRVPLASFDPATVKDTINAQVGPHHAVASLTS